MLYAQPHHTNKCSSNARDAPREAYGVCIKAGLTRELAYPPPSLVEQVWHTPLPYMWRHTVAPPRSLPQPLRGPLRKGTHHSSSQGLARQYPRGEAQLTPSRCRWTGDYKTQSAKTSTRPPVRVHSEIIYKGVKKKSP